MKTVTDIFEVLALGYILVVYQGPGEEKPTPVLTITDPMTVEECLNWEKRHVGYPVGEEQDGKTVVAYYHGCKPWDSLAMSSLNLRFELKATNQFLDRQ